MSRMRLLRLPVLAMALCLVTGCTSWFGSDEVETTPVTVFDVQPGMCFNPPASTVELTELLAVPCDVPHSQEAYAVVKYRAPQGADPNAYPGDATLFEFANGACAEEFESYVGVSYLDSSLFYTPLVPSARSWEQGNDREVTCFIMTTGQPLTASVAGSRL